MEFKIFNTLTRQKEIFTPIDENKIRVYSCGPTVYSDPHVGNLRYFFFCGLLGDTLRLIYGKEHVKHVMNITDVGHLTDDGDAGEDKMEKGARREGLTAWDIAKKYENNFKKYIEQLHIEFDELPRATDNIQEQIDIIKMLEEKAYTYEIPGDGIYMDTSKIADYGKLMGPNYHKHLEGLQAGARVDIEGKRNATDFALWKFSPVDQQRQMEWDSPWGKGFPGWHIECNAMSRRYLGDHFDIHTGGVDHITVHHSDEIAQAECSYAAEKPWVNYWMHVQFLNINGAKVSKSAGDDFSLPALKKEGISPEDLRFFFLRANYGTQQNFTLEELKRASIERNQLWTSMNYLLNSTFNLVKEVGSLEDLENNLITDMGKQMLEKLMTALLDNLNVVNLISTIYAYRNSFVHDQTPTQRTSSINFNTQHDFLIDFVTLVKFFDDQLLKLDLFQEVWKKEITTTPEIHKMAEEAWNAKMAKDEKTYFQIILKMQIKSVTLDNDKPNIIVIPHAIMNIAADRWKAKQAKDYAKADQLRADLEAAGWEMRESKDDYIVSPLKH